MLLRRLFKVRPAVEAGRKLYAAAVAQARQPRFYTDFAAPDTREGRFDLYTLHVVLLVRRLKGEGEQAAETSQALFDAYLRGLDDAFRELGASDLSVAKKMKKLGQAFYGRARAYEEAFAALPDTAASSSWFQMSSMLTASPTATPRRSSSSTWPVICMASAG